MAEEGDVMGHIGGMLGNHHQYRRLEELQSLRPQLHGVNQTAAPIAIQMRMVSTTDSQLVC